MRPFRIGSSALALVFCLSCISLNYPEDPEDPSDPDRLPVANATAKHAEREAETPVIEPALSWSDLTRLAREHRQRGELEKARERLAQAALQVRPLAPTHARRRTVFGMQARLAMELAAAGKIEIADELADALLAEAEMAPELGRAALVSLALSVADRRQSESPLPLLRIALTTAQAGSTSRDRMNLAFHVAYEAYQEKDFALARRAIDQAIVDAQHVGPTKKERIASFELYKSRIALAQVDLETAEMSATAANRIFEEISADPSNRGVAEATLAEILAKKGEVEKALSIARGAHGRIGEDEPIEEHARRLILASLARVENIAGDSASARVHFEQALAIPTVDVSADLDLVEQLRIELQELDETGTASSLPSAPE